MRSLLVAAVLAITLAACGDSPMSEQEYFAWCDSISVTESHDLDELTNGEFSDHIGNSLKKIRSVTPPESLSEYHASMDQFLTSVKHLVDTQPRELPFNIFLFLDLTTESDRHEAVIASLPEGLRQVLQESACT